MPQACTMGKDRGEGENPRSRKSNASAGITDLGKLRPTPGCPCVLLANTGDIDSAAPRSSLGSMETVRPVLPMSSEGGETELWQHQALTVVVFGASGDLAKKKTYPSLFDLYLAKFLPRSTVICGYARSAKSDEEFRAHLLPFLQKKNASDAQLHDFLSICFYCNGQAYGDSAALSSAVNFCAAEHSRRAPNAEAMVENRVFYLALPPKAFVEASANINAVAMSSQGSNRVVVEKPFGRDTASAARMREDLGAIFTEDKLYRIDHYLGKEMVQNMMVLRFGNSFLSKLWSRDHISSVVITFKEDFGTQGRGGYFDSSGIIRDVMQNHLMQILSIVAMEPPVKVSGTGYSNHVRDEKVKVLQCMQPIRLEDVIIGQYVTNGTEPGYTDDPTVPEGSICPTFCCAVMYVNNPRWEGVPFVMKAGKALDTRKAEVRMQFRAAPGSNAMFDGMEIPRNELVIRLQPDEAIYMKTNVKRPGLHTKPVQSELDLSYTTRYPAATVTDAYTRLLLDVLRGKQATFVRDDELMAAWEIFTPLLHQLECESIRPEPYVYGGRGPQSADDLIKRVRPSTSAVWLKPQLPRPLIEHLTSLPRNYAGQILIAAPLKFSFEPLVTNSKALGPPCVLSRTRPTS